MDYSAVPLSTRAAYENVAHIMRGIVLAHVGFHVFDALLP